MPKERMIPGEDRLVGQGVSYCATCDGPLFRGATVAAVGHGEEALEDVHALLRPWAAGSSGCPARPAARPTRRRPGPSRAKGLVIRRDGKIKEIRGEERVESVLVESASGAEDRSGRGRVHLPRDPGRAALRQGRRSPSITSSASPSTASRGPTCPASSPRATSPAAGSRSWRRPARAAWRGHAGPHPPPEMRAPFRQAAAGRPQPGLELGRRSSGTRKMVTRPPIGTAMRLRRMSWPKLATVRMGRGQPWRRRSRMTSAR
ncbi:MAG: hypothetical protein M0C28_20900 [Candidatus Moduliflexus flocculans]|nr:hypothetical protein [Candidatus Moduliflexus flocculans]